MVSVLVPPVLDQGVGKICAARRGMEVMMGKMRLVGRGH